MCREYRFYVYTVQSASRRALYIGLTNDLHRRAFQHKTHAMGALVVVGGPLEPTIETVPQNVLKF
jgi:predicted GIY-YIG superfamily endonuclease